MPLLALLAAVAAISFEELIEFHFGVVGVVGLLLVTIGVKAKNLTCGCIGAVVLAMLLAQ
ncbi:MULTISPECIES: hypothetical protein [Streptomyces]|uniref:Uncharacterized protein n=1 Tax=Streptomyces lycii TaxID=2654337 RepID=A0ABQ7FDP3_9ACTN|nr:MULTISPECIES: hypothetical protein [Streptomyces]KAF4407126.1 hypothetical protein GCU69_21290 [Streptomyces lycii]PGH49160.1 hypothetical protein CRI70_19235 [Streptomyces sp. Ru87]